MSWWLPTARLSVVKIAWLPAPTAPVPRNVAPAVKVTTPVGVPAVGGVTITVAVKVTAWP